VPGHATEECLSIAWKSYQRPFLSPLETSSGSWTLREGILVKAEHLETGHIGFGEVAPLPSFGSESLKSAETYLRSISGNLTRTQLASAIETAPPSTGFALWSALNTPRGEGPSPTAGSAALLSLNHDAPAAISQLQESGYRTFKLKTGIRDRSLEWDDLQAAASVLESGGRIRLDPNQSWDITTAAFWLPRLETIASRIEFIEEPLHQDLVTVKQLATVQADTPILLALDESLSRHGLEEWIEAGWPGYWIIKPSLQGLPDGWLQQLSFARDKVVLSSVFESGIGMSALIAIAAGFPGKDHGLGTQAFFRDSFGVSQTGSTLKALDKQEQDILWNRLSSD
jgi:O-succinylbenzoate synthase